MSSSTAQKPQLPAIHLLTRFEKDSKAFQDAVDEYFPTLNQYTTITINNCSLAKLPASVAYDTIVSPANSYGFMDGAFDDAITKALSPNPREGYGWTTKKVQNSLYQQSRGYAPPGSCTIIDVRRDAAWHEIKNAEKPGTAHSLDPVAGEEHKAGCKWIALCPTMRVPRTVKWDKEVVFECIWSLLCAIDTHNQKLQDPESQIKTILMTPLATGVGRVSEQKWAAQCVLAMRYWVEAVENPGKWSNLQWEHVYDDSCQTMMLESTHDL